MKRYRGIGLMSGTSLDGVDLAYCEFSLGEGEEAAWAFELLVAETIPIDETWYARLKCLDEQDAETFAKTNIYFGHYLGKILRDFIGRNELKPEFVASHGQTIFHQPEKSFTAQIGDGETIAAYLPCPLVSNFRNKDVAMGGQGAPLVPFGEKHLFPETQLFLNLGGFSNLTFGELAYDIAPVNFALNWLARSKGEGLEYDPDGSIAATGDLDSELFMALEELAYYQAKPPKSLGAEWFESHILPLIADTEIPIEDRLYTYVTHIVSRIGEELIRIDARGEKILITGGGVRNTFLMDMLTETLNALKIELVTDVSEQVVDFKEAIVFAFLGLETLLGEPNILASVTGAEVGVCGGSIHLPVGGGWKLL